MLKLKYASITNQQSEDMSVKLDDDNGTGSGGRDGDSCKIPGDGSDE